MLYRNVRDVAIITFKGFDYCCFIYSNSKSEAIHLLENSILEDRKSEAIHLLENSALEDRGYI